MEPASRQPPTPQPVDRDVMPVSLVVIPLQPVEHIERADHRGIACRSKPWKEARLFVGGVLWCGSGELRQTAPSSARSPGSS